MRTKYRSGPNMYRTSDRRSSPTVCLLYYLSVGHCDVLLGNLSRLRTLQYTVVFPLSVRGRMPSAVTTARPRFVQVGHAWRAGETARMTNSWSKKLQYICDSSVNLLDLS